jgi:hypothetical protein
MKTIAGSRLARARHTTPLSLARLSSTCLFSNPLGGLSAEIMKQEPAKMSKKNFFPVSGEVCSFIGIFDANLLQL